MNIAHLKLFARVAVTQNISLAGKEFGLSAAVSSSHISKLEEHLGVKLIHRSTRKVALTEAGQEFLPHAKQVLETVEAAKAAVGTGSITPQGTLRVTAPASFGHLHIVPALKGFFAAYPEVKIDLHLSDSMIDMVGGGFDVAIRNSKMNDSTLIARRLAKDSRIICAAPEYLATYGEPKTPKELAKHQMIKLAGLDTWLFATPTGEQRIKVQSHLQIDNGESVKNACIDGIGITLCSRWIAYQDLKQGRLVQILSDYPLISETAIWAVYPSSRLLAPKVRAFIDYFVDYFGEVPYWEEG